MIRNAYGQYTVTDFLNDEDFLQWIKHPDMTRNAYWERIILEYPHQEAVIGRARELVEALGAPLQQGHEEGRRRVWDHIQAGMRNEPLVRRIRIWRGVAVAASIAALLATGMYLYRSAPFAAPAGQQLVAVPEIGPGGNQAVLTLANGSKIALNNRQDGLVASEGGASIQKTAEGEVAYTAGDRTAAVEINQMETPPGGQYRLTLPDGTKVWLNAVTKLRYPTRFTGGERRVEVSGEAYFEVVPKAGMPFYVVSAGHEVAVLGTEFNINCYPDEAVTSTTLLSGAVRVTNTRHNVSGVLRPGQQARVGAGGGPLQIGTADVEGVTGWRDGYFVLNGEDLESLMRKIARWYNVEVVYEGPRPNVALSGIVSRSKKLQEVLDVMEMTGSLHCKISGRRVVVTQ